MTDDELIDALIGIYIYDTGCPGIGIHDELLRAECVAQLKTWPVDQASCYLALRYHVWSETRI